MGISGRVATTLSNTSIFAKGGEQGGTILIGNDAQHGTLPFSQVTSLDALTLIDTSATAGRGGHIETSGNTLNLLATINAGRGGMWLIDPWNYTIGTTEASYIQTALNAGSNVLITTATSPASVGANSITGASTTAVSDSITVNSAISATSGAGPIRRCWCDLPSCSRSFQSS